MSSAIVLLRKGFSTLAYDGPSAFLHKTRQFVRRNLSEQRARFLRHKHFRDVLFINGCTLEHPSRYRVEHQIEQLSFAGCSADSVSYTALDLDLVRYYRAFVFFRCPHTPVVEELIRRAKGYNKPVLFDIDDLVIDDKYVRTIKYLKTMTSAELDHYMDGVHRMRRTLRLCDTAITTTKPLATELAQYVPEVFVNRNVASEKMVALSNAAFHRRKPAADGSVVLGYFSGSITHNDDFRMILPALVRIFQDFPQVRLKIVGILDLPPELAQFPDRVVAEKFVPWTRLPGLIASADVNLAPLEDSLFNEAKSENRWLEAALVGVPTVASDVGATAEVTRNGETAVLCRGADDWYRSIAELVRSPEKRDRIAGAAREQALRNCVTASTSLPLANLIRSRTRTSVVFVLPSTQVSGGVNVVVRHAAILRKHGADVTLLSLDDHEQAVEVGGTPVVAMRRTFLHASFDRAVATLWSTVDMVNRFPKFASRYYLVQNFETDFYPYGDPRRVFANSTYSSSSRLNYITISRWCQAWLKERFGKTAAYAPNGIDLSVFLRTDRNFSGKIRVLVEGNSEDHYKNVDESFRITNQLERDRFEVWYLSYQGKPKKWYRVDRFLHKVPYASVAEVYQSCHLLVKSSLLESFSYPPLEMMATGGIAIVASNAGNAEYLRDRQNCLLYPAGNAAHAVGLIQQICRDAALRDRIIAGGLATAAGRDWRTIEDDIRKLYDV